MDNIKIRMIFEYEFRRGTNAAQTARNINAMFGSQTTNQRTVRYWFNRFRSGNFDLENESRGRPETKVNNDELRAMVESDPSQTSSELAARFKVSVKTILIHLNQIGVVRTSKHGGRKSTAKSEKEIKEKVESNKKSEKKRRKKVVQSGDEEDDPPLAKSSKIYSKGSTKKKNSVSPSKDEDKAHKSVPKAEKASISEEGSDENYSGEEDKS